MFHISKAQVTGGFLGPPVSSAHAYSSRKTKPRGQPVNSRLCGYPDTPLVVNSGDAERRVARDDQRASEVCAGAVHRSQARKRKAGSSRTPPNPPTGPIPKCPKIGPPEGRSCIPNARNCGLNPANLTSEVCPETGLGGGCIIPDARKYTSAGGLMRPWYA